MKSEVILSLANVKPARARGTSKPRSAGNANRWADNMQKEILKYLEENPGANYYEVSMLFAPRRSKVGYPKGYSDYSCVRRVLNNIIKRGYAKLDGQRLYICPTMRATDAEDSAPSQTESNAETLSNSDGSAVPARRS